MLLRTLVRIVHYGEVVGTIAELGSIQIRIYPRDHLPPHFHISTTYGEAVVRIADLAVLKGRLRTSDLRRVLQWAAEHKRFIEDEWYKQN